MSEVGVMNDKSMRSWGTMTVAAAAAAVVVYSDRCANGRGKCSTGRGRCCIARSSLGGEGLVGDRVGTAGDCVGVGTGKTEAGQGHHWRVAVRGSIATGGCRVCVSGVRVE